MASSNILINLIIIFAVTVMTPLSAEEGKTGRYLGARSTVMPEWFKDSFLDLREDVDEAAGEGRRVVLFFHQEGCPYCNRLVEHNLGQKDIQQRVQEHLDVIEVNMWGDREITGLDGNQTTEKLFAEQLRVQFTPTLLFLDEQGEVVLRLNGYLSPEVFRVALDYVIDHHESETSFRQYLADNRTVSGTDKLLPEPYFMPPPYALVRNPKRPGQPVAVFFEQPKCPDCEYLHREVLVDPAIRKIIEQFDVVQLDIWKETPVLTPSGERTNARVWAQALNITYAPTIVLFDGSGKEVIRSEAFFKRFHTESILDYVLSGDYHSQPSFQRYISDRAEHIRELGKDVDIWR
ncbi:MAG: thioredoxin fold domain-containing protein [Gammaproteobacteria bacterium]|nr:thioredoxin fold domain-containing protein [Gammaproteobacteria bacterium]